MSYKSPFAKIGENIFQILLASKLVDVGEEPLSRDASKGVLDPETRPVIAEQSSVRGYMPGRDVGVQVDRWL